MSPPRSSPATWPLLTCSVRNFVRDSNECSMSNSATRWFPSFARRCHWLVVFDRRGFDSSRSSLLRSHFPRQIDLIEVMSCRWKKNLTWIGPGRFEVCFVIFGKFIGTRDVGVKQESSSLQWTIDSLETGLSYLIWIHLGFSYTDNIRRDPDQCIRCWLDIFIGDLCSQGIQCWRQLRTFLRSDDLEMHLAWSENSWSTLLELHDSIDWLLQSTEISMWIAIWYCSVWWREVHPSQSLNNREQSIEHSDLCDTRPQPIHSRGSDSIDEQLRHKSLQWVDLL